jgi:predicted lipoprotein with Yx(FWY)xxD motif
MLIRRFLAVPLFLALAACSTAGTSTPAAATPTTQPTASATRSTEASESAAEGTEIETDDSDLGTILVDADGETIYFFADDEEGVSNCTADCLANWPPVHVEGTPEAGSGVSAELGSFKRDDGTEQLTVNGYPAYYFAGDQSSGDTNGQGLFDKWYVFGADGEPIKKS